MTHADVYFPLAEPFGSKTHAYVEGSSDGYLSGVGAQLWASAGQFERMRQACLDSCGHLAFAYPDGSVEFKEADYIAEGFLDAERDDARVAAGPFKDVPMERVEAWVESMAETGELDPEFLALVRKEPLPERFGAKGSMGIGDYNSKLVAGREARALAGAFLSGAESARLIAERLEDGEPTFEASTQYIYEAGRWFVACEAGDGGPFEAALANKEGYVWLPVSQALAASEDDLGGAALMAVQGGLGQADFDDLAHLLRAAGPSAIQARRSGEAARI